MSLLIKAKDVNWHRPEVTVVDGSAGPRIDVAFTYGEKSNLMIGRRGPGYHSVPHKHESEQLNYCMEGSLWMYVDGIAYLLEPGDFLRIPAWSMHWAWNRSGQSNLLMEVHTPVVNLSHVPFAVGLFGATEDPRIDQARKNEYVYPEMQEFTERRNHGDPS